MDQKRNKAIFLLIALQNIVHGADRYPKEGQSVDIPCSAPDQTRKVFWLRVVDHRVEFIGSSIKSVVKSFPNKLNLFDIKPGNTLQVRSFQAARDAGVYSCASLDSSTLTFGEDTRLMAPDVIVATVQSLPTTTAGVSSTTPCRPCDVKTGQARSGALCDPIILGSLAGGCGLLLLLLVTTIVYCNRMRTRHCPHHYMRQKQRKQVK